MEIWDFFSSILILLVLTTAFCWLMTADLGWGPIAYVAAFFGGMISIGWAGVAYLNFKERQ